MQTKFYLVPRNIGKIVFGLGPFQTQSSALNLTKNELYCCWHKATTLYSCVTGGYNKLFCVYIHRHSTTPERQTTNNKSLRRKLSQSNWYFISQFRTFSNQFRNILTGSLHQNWIGRLKARGNFKNCGQS